MRCHSGLPSYCRATALATRWDLWLARAASCKRTYPLAGPWCLLSLRAENKALREELIGTRKLVGDLKML